MTTEIVHILWRRDNVFTGAYAGEYLVPVVQWIALPASNPDVVGSSPPAVDLWR
jgi:hypothetical protein